MYFLELFGRVCCDLWWIDSDWLGILRSFIFGFFCSFFFIDFCLNWNYNSVLLDFKLFYLCLINFCIVCYIGLVFVCGLFFCVWVEVGFCCCCWIGCNCCFLFICFCIVWWFSVGIKWGLFFFRGFVLMVDIY